MDEGRIVAQAVVIALRERSLALLGYLNDEDAALLERIRAGARSDANAIARLRGMPTVFGAEAPADLDRAIVQHSATVEGAGGDRMEIELAKLLRELGLYLRTSDEAHRLDAEQMFALSPGTCSAMPRPPPVQHWRTAARGIQDFAAHSDSESILHRWWMWRHR